VSESFLSAREVK